jgi:NAD(P)-dependent dehydrogenase (short-subunit alcohol dehydrogenase family)
MNGEFENKVVVISGATGGLGQEAARQFAAQGAHLAPISNDRPLLTQMEQDLMLDSRRILTQEVDLLQSTNTDRVADEIISRFGRVDILLHLVGGWIGGKSVMEVDPQEISQMLNQHLWTTFNMTRALAPKMISNNWGRIVVVSSPLAVNPAAKMSPYSIGKAAQETLVVTLARELQGSGVTANIIQVKAIDVQGEKITKPTKENATWSTPQEIMAAIHYLCSENARGVNGARVALYGT